MAVLKQPNQLLLDRLEQLSYKGFCVIERWEVMAWFKAKERITNVVWRAILSAWELHHDQDQIRPLQLIKCDDSTTPQAYVLVVKDRLLDFESLTIKS